MLVTLKEILKDAEQKQVAIGSFNTPNLESIMAVIGAAEELDVPVILMHAQVHEEIMPLDVIGPVMLEKAEKARVPVCVHLDHGESIDYIARAFRLGFTSAMYDGSLLPFDENVANTCKVVEMAKEYHASVEAEIGTLGKREGGGPDSEDSVQIYTDPEDAQRFVEATGIDALACSFGTAHGLYLKKPQLDMSVLDGVRQRVPLPLVMHGGSGVSEEDYRAVIARGVRKINYYTYMAKAGGQAVREKILQSDGQPVFFHDIVNWGIDGMKQDVKRALRVFNMQEKER